MARMTRVRSTSSYRSLQTARILVLIFTVIFILTGFLFLVTGTYAQMRLNYLVSLLQNTALAATHLTPLLLIFIGVFIILTSILGFFSAIKDNLCIINCFCLLLTLVCVTEVIGGILACSFLPKFRSAVKEGMEFEIGNFTTNSTMNEFQTNLGCCGVESYLDYNMTSWSLEEKDFCLDSVQIPHLQINIPTTCCMDECQACNMTSSVMYYEQGCLEKLFGKNDDKFILHYLVITTIALMVLQIVGILSTVCLFRRLRTTLRGY